MVLPTTLHDGQGAVPAAFGLAQRGQRVGRFAGLRDDQQDGVAFQRRVAIAEFVREFHFDRQMGQFLDQIFAHQRRVPARAAGGDDDAVQCRAIPPRVMFKPPNFAVAPSKSMRPRKRVLDGARLLENFLEHEMRDIRRARRPARRIPAG